MMKKLVLLMLMLTSMFSFSAFSATNSCGRISLIGEFNGWKADHFMTRNLDKPDEWTTLITLTPAQDADTNGIIEMKFRENADWTNNWGSTDFPSGTGVNGGKNIPVPLDSLSGAPTTTTYEVTFNCSTGAYTFTKTCGQISLIGEFNSWSGDLKMMRNDTSLNNWSAYITLTPAEDADSNGYIEMKFRENAGWAVNWGSTDFPSGTGINNGKNIPVPLDSLNGATTSTTYKVMFNCSTGVYSFTKTCGEIGIIGEFNGWAADWNMTRSKTDPDNWSTILTLTAAEDADSNGIIELKFRENAGWAVNWGSSDFPSGTATQDGPNIKVPLDSVGTTTDYKVTFNCSTGAYTFTHTSGQVSMIGAFNNWNGDVDMWRDATDPNVWHLIRSWAANSEVKFRENHDWSHNWGNNTFPTGTGTDNGPNIPLVAGTYNITFNSSTAAYSFVSDTSVCGEIGLIGDFNNWGTPDDATKPPTDVYMVRDPKHPFEFSITYNFTSSTKLLFRENADATFTNVWGGTDFPTGTGVKDPTKMLNVPGGKYKITFNYLSGDYNFVRLGNSVIAPKVFSITVDGSLNENDWNLDQNVSRFVYGKSAKPDNVKFGVTYNDKYLYVGVDVKSYSAVSDSNSVVFFVDGNKSGGAYDDHDVAFGIDAGGNTFILKGPKGFTIDAKVVKHDTSFTVETAISFKELGLTPAEGQQMGFDLAVAKGYSNGTPAKDAWVMAWNGDLSDTASTSAFGDLLFGKLSCGNISFYNATIGDVSVRPLPDDPNTYVATYQFMENQDIHFRKDNSNSVTWGSTDFPTGTAVLNGDAIPAAQGRYRVSFNCMSGDYSFKDAPAGDNVADAVYTTTPIKVDGDLSGYNLKYHMAAGNVTGTQAVNNTVNWGALWNDSSVYIAAHVVDAVVEGSGNPWDNDGIEFYFNGDDSKAGAYNKNYDTQLILDAKDTSSLWIKADGVPITDYTSAWKLTSDGYNVELRLGWDNFHFAPGKGRVIGFSISNNDSDNGTGRDYQTTWYGTADNWNNTGVLGDLELTGGPYFVLGVHENVLYNANVGIFPNPATTNVTIRSIGKVFKGNVTISLTDITGRMIMVRNENFGGSNSFVRMNISNVHTGIYFVNIISADGKRAVKKLIVE
jgi:hypothetical protein